MMYNVNQCSFPLPHPCFNMRVLIVMVFVVGFKLPDESMCFSACLVYTVPLGSSRNRWSCSNHWVQRRLNLRSNKRWLAIASSHYVRKLYFVYSYPTVGLPIIFVDSPTAVSALSINYTSFKPIYDHYTLTLKESTSAVMSLSPFSLTWSNLT